MKEKTYPSHYRNLSRQYPEVFAALESLGTSIRNAGPLDQKTAELIQLAAAAAIQSEGSVHSHARRALEAGASAEEIQHALFLLISTMGFPRTAAALSWVNDVIS